MIQDSKINGKSDLRKLMIYYTGIIKVNFDHIAHYFRTKSINMLTLIKNKNIIR